MIIPHYINTQGIKPQGFYHLNTVFPILNRDAGIVHLASVYFGTLLRVETTGVNIRLEWLISPTIMEIGC